MTRTRWTEARKLAWLTERLDRIWTANTKRLAMVTDTAYLTRCATLTRDRLNAYARKEFSDGRVLTLDGERVRVTYASGGWSLMREP